METNHPFVKAAPKNAEFHENWPLLGDKPAVFITEFEIPAAHALNPGKLAKPVALFSGAVPDEHGYTIHYLLVEPRGKARHVHQLYQGGKGVDYQSKAEHEREAREPAGKKITAMTPEVREWISFGGEVIVAMQQLTGATNTRKNWDRELLAEYKQAGSPKAKKHWICEKLKPRFNWISRRPRWTEDEGNWSFVGDKPMIFLGQVYVAEDAPDGSPGGDMSYLFFDQGGSDLEFKVMRQSCGEQTAEDHYELEAMIASFHQAKGSAKAANELVKQGDRWAHRFLLEQPKLASETLALLVKHGANREIKDEAKVRLPATGGKK